ncbi:MAG: DUF1559 domain-containing protein [Planctomycetota bacterium]
MRRTTAYRPAGFTLIELLVVISIIALLIGLLLPALGAARAAGRNVACLSNIKQMGIGLYVYSEENKGSLPYGLSGGEDGVFQPTNGDNSDWGLDILNVMNGTSLKTWEEEGQAGGIQAGTSNLFACPAALAQIDDENRTRQYAAHPLLMPQIVTPDLFTFNQTGATNFLKPARVETIRNATTQFMVTDVNQNTTDGNNGEAILNKANFAGGGTSDSPYLRAGVAGFNYAAKSDMGTNEDRITNEPIGQIRFRHPGNNANFLFVDGHGGSLGNYKDKFSHNLESETLYVQF